jgi:tetratricopeptide (TPR) repeat protein
MTALALASILALALAGPPQETTPKPSPEQRADAAVLAARERQARQAMAEGRYDEAATLYRELLAKLPNEPGVLMNLGIALTTGGHAQEAIEPLTRASKLKPALQPTWLFLGTAYLDLGQPEKAIAPLRKFVEAQPQHVDSRQMLAAALLMTGDAPDALQQYQRLTKLATTDPKTWSGLVQSYDALAQAALQHLHSATDADAEAYRTLILAEAFESEDKHEQAFAMYRRALDTLPRFRTIHDALADIYDKTGHQDWAATERAKAETIALTCRTDATDSAAAECAFREKRYAAAVSAIASREDAESQYWRARAYAELALDAFGRLAALPSSQELHELKAELYRNEGRHLQSVEELTAALKFAPKDPRLLKELAKAYYLSRDTEHARAILQKLADRPGDQEGESGDPEVSLLYGQVLLDSQQAEDALPYLKMAAEHTPASSSADAHAALGRAFVQLGQAAEAIPHLKAALAQQDDEDGSLHYQLARAYQATGQTDLAKPLLEEYQARQRATQSRAEAAPADAKITPP